MTRGLIAPAKRTAFVRRLVDRAGQTYCEQAGFALRDKPSPLYQLLVLASLLAKPIGADLAVAACRELRRAGLRTPAAMMRASWQDRVDALGRAHYRRYDESTATRLGDAADLVRRRYGGDLRRLAERSGQDVERAGELLTEFPGIGPAGAGIFLREAQLVWPWLVPYIDDRMREGARELGLPHSAARLAGLVADREPARVSAALVRASLDEHLVADLRGDRRERS